MTTESHKLIDIPLKCVIVSKGLGSDNLRIVEEEMHEGARAVTFTSSKDLPFFLMTKLRYSTIKVICSGEHWFTFSCDKAT